MYKYLVIIKFFIFSFSWAQVNLKLNESPIAQKYLFENFTTKDGLPSNETFCVFQDSRDYIWIGTDRGLVMYNGYEFKTYTTLDGLQDNVILALNEDSNGNLWYSGLNNNAVGYIDSKMLFHKYAHQKKLIEYTKKIINRNIHFNTLEFDSTNIIFSNSRYGLLELNDEGDVIRELSNSDDIFETHILDYKNFSRVVLLRNQIDHKILSNKIIDSNKRVLGTYLRQNVNEIFPSIVQNDSSKTIYDWYRKISISEDSIQVHNVNELIYSIQLSKDLILYSVSKSNDKECKVFLSKSINFEDDKNLILDGPRITNAILDKDNGLWLTSTRHGVYYFPSLNSMVTSNNEPIESIIPLDSGLIYGTLNTQYYLDKHRSEIYQLKEEPDILDLFQSTTNINIQNFIAFKESSNSRRAKGYYKVSDSLMYLINGVYLEKVERIDDEIRIETVLTNDSHILDIYCFNEDSCLLATHNGIYHYDKNGLEKTWYSPDKRTGNINTVKNDSIILFTVLGEGLHIVKNGQKLSFSEEDGLNSNTINQVFVDVNNTIWISTNKGINSLQIENGEFIINKVLGQSRILKSPNIIQLYVEDSLLYIGTDKGINVLDLKSEKKDKVYELPIKITQLSVNNEDHNISEMDTFNYDQNNIVFSFIAISPKKFSKINYKYRLRGLSDEWIETTERKATFFKIEPGSYEFDLQAEDEFGNWIKAESIPKIYIDKPYWKKWWFIAGTILCGIVILGGILYYYILNLKKEKLFVENEQHLSEELNESRQKALSAQLNPHFVFNSLNSIQNFILTKRTELSSDYLSMFSKLMRFVFENSKKLYVPLQDEIEAIRLYLELEQVRHNHTFKYIVQTPEIELNSIFIPSLLVQPIIENAIWHGLLHKKSKDRLLEISFYVNDKSLHIDVKDNGVGRGNSKPRLKIIDKQKSSGVELTKQRLRLLSESTGLKTNFDIIDLFNENNQPNGTCVKISIPLHLSNNHK